VQEVSETSDTRDATQYHPLAPGRLGLASSSAAGGVAKQLWWMGLGMGIGMDDLKILEISECLQISTDTAEMRCFGWPRMQIGRCLMA